jgi:diguanylate cyclase (GGDEF)-like protein/PAS domain S-box-containing protein
MNTPPNDGWVGSAELACTAEAPHACDPEAAADGRPASPAERQLRQSEARFRDFVELAADWFWETDADLRYVYLSERYHTATGLPPDSRLGQRRGEFRLTGPDDGDWAAHFADLQARRPFRNFRFAYIDGAGRRRVANMSGRPTFDEAGTFTGYRGVGRDITEEHTAQQQLVYLARHDPLTGLANRTMLKDRLQQTLAAARRNGTGVAILSVDLDDFKLINDTLGHAAGDAVLRAMAQRMGASLREVDTAARVGGDEFTIVLADTSGWEAARALANRLLDSLTEIIDIGGEQVRCGASIGISLFPHDGRTPDKLLRHADLALYKAKAQGSNTFCFFVPEMNEQVRERRQLEQQLMLAPRDGSLFLEYQPQVEIEGGRIVGLEALVRWMRPGHGLVRPDAFIEIAERSGLILDIDRWVLREACAQAKRWSDAGLFPGRVAVNLSAMLLAHPRLVEDIRQTLQATGLAPDRLEIEITESVLLVDTDTVAGTLDALSGMGIGLAVDDFGTGYSSLTYLRRFPVQKVKIDRSFVRNVSQDPDDAVIARAIVSLGHSLDLHVVAEGVENAEQLAFLRQAGCDQVQGYFLGRPMKAPACEAYLRRADAEASRATSAVVSLSARYAHT